MRPSDRSPGVYPKEYLNENFRFLINMWDPITIKREHGDEYRVFRGLILYLLNQMNPRFKSFKSDAEHRSALFRHLIAFAILISIPLILVFLDFNSRHGGIFFIADAIFTIFVTVVVVNSLSRRRDAVD
jgi:heme/copper-type cytochrome/quinol oxidase subunit 4